MPQSPPTASSTIAEYPGDMGGGVPSGSSAAFNTAMRARVLRVTRNGLRPSRPGVGIYGFALAGVFAATAAARIVALFVNEVCTAVIAVSSAGVAPAAVAAA